MADQNKSLAQAIKFTLFSISAGIIQVASFALLELFITDYWIPYLVSLVLSIVWNFTLNRKLTFRSANHVPTAMLKVACFYLVFTPLSTWTGNALSGLGWTPAEYRERIAAVTPAQVAEAAKKLKLHTTYILKGENHE